MRTGAGNSTPKKIREQHFWVGCDIGGTKLLTVVFNQRFRAMARVRKKNKPGLGAKAGVVRIGDSIDAALAVAGVEPRQVRGIGLGAAGFLNLDRGMILHAPNLGWRRVAIRDQLHARFRMPVTLINDVDAGTYAEYRIGVARGARCVVGVFLGTGIGGACVYEGRLIRGKTASAMEIGHICVQPNGNRCGCGRFGCLETVASRLAIAAQLATAAQRQDTPALPGLIGLNIAAIRSGLIAAALRAGDTAANAIVRHAARQVGIALAAPLHLLAPDMILLGGGLVEEMPELFVREVSAGLKENCVASYARNLRIVAAALGDDAVAAGAAVFAADTTDPIK